MDDIIFHITSKKYQRKSTFWGWKDLDSHKSWTALQSNMKCGEHNM